MAGNKQSGLGDNFYIAGKDLSNDTSAISAIRQPRVLLPCTGLDKSAMERFYGLRDGEMSFTTYFNDAALQEHATLSTLPTADVICSYFHGTTQGNKSAALVAKQVNYDGNRGADGSLTFDVQMLANGYGLEWGQMLTAGKRQDTTATSPASGADNPDAAATNFGMAGYLHVFSFTGTSCTVRIQDSADNSSFANITGVGAFAAASGVTSERIESDTLARTIRRYLRVITTGTFSECTFAVTAIRYRADGRLF